MHRASLLLGLLTALAIGEESATSAATVPPIAPAAVAPTPEQFLARVKEAQADHQNVRLRFVQEKNLAILDEPIRTPGLIEISRPQRAVRWEFTGKSVLVFLDGKVRRWGAEGKEEKANDPNLKSFHDQMKALLDGDWSGLLQAFEVTPDADGTSAMTLTPRSKDLAKYIARIRIRFRPDFGAPAEMRLVATGGDETIYAFAEPEQPAEIPAARFAGP